VTGNIAAEVMFERDRLIVSSVLPSGHVLEVGFADWLYSAPSVDGRASVPVAYAELYGLAVLDPKLWARSDNGGDRQELNLPLLLRQIDIRTSAEFGERVQSLRDRMTDSEAVRFAARRLLMTPDSRFDDRAAAICAIGYRIVEARDPQDSDIDFLRSAARETLAMVPRSERYARWITSVTMVLTYVAVLLRDAEETEAQLIETLSYRPFLPQLSLLHTNFSRCNLLLSLIRAARCDIVGAYAALDDIDQVFRIGVRSSWIDDNIRGRSQFSEIFAVMKVAQLADDLKAGLEEAAGQGRTAEFAASTDLTSISPIVKSLQVGGHWTTVLAQASASKAAAGNRRKSEMAAISAAQQTPPAPAQASDGLSQRIAAWLSNDIGQEFADAVASLRSDVADALCRDDASFAQQAEVRLAALFAHEADLRRRLMLGWPTLRMLGDARLLVGCLMALETRETAYRSLRDQTSWCKYVLAAYPISGSADYDNAALFVFTGQLSYLVANRYLVPQQRHVADRSIPQDFAKTFGRVFRDEQLQVKVTHIIETLAP
jgi:hypothetical protein